jgi:hypothetical protein
LVAAAVALVAASSARSAAFSAITFWCVVNSACGRETGVT